VEKKIKMYLFETVDMEEKPKFVFTNGEKRVKVEIKTLMKEIFKCVRTFKHGKIISTLLMLFFYAAYVKEIAVQCFSALTRRKGNFKKQAEDKLKRYGAKMNGLFLNLSILGVDIDGILERIGEVTYPVLKREA